MTCERARFAAAAESLLGTPFRFRGRDPESGIDCVGLVELALAAIGRSPAGPRGYAMRQADPHTGLECAQLCGFEPAKGAVEPGDLVLVRPGPAQVHLLIAAKNGGFVHAHAGLGRIVRTPPPCPWPIDRHWRLSVS